MSYGARTGKNAWNAGQLESYAVWQTIGSELRKP